MVFSVTVPPKASMERIPTPLRGTPGIQAAANQAQTVLNAGATMAAPTSAQYPKPATAMATPTQMPTNWVAASIAVMAT